MLFLLTCRFSLLLVCLSGKCIVATWLIVSGCCLGWWVGSVEEWVYFSWVHLLHGEGEILEVFHCHWFEWRIFNRNVFDSCVESWQYFCTVSMSLETSVHWLSGQISSRSRLGFMRNLQKCNSHFTQQSSQAATPSTNLIRKVNVLAVTLVPDIWSGHFGSWALLVCRILWCE